MIGRVGHHPAREVTSTRYVSLSSCLGEERCRAGRSYQPWVPPSPKCLSRNIGQASIGDVKNAAGRALVRR